MFLSAYILVIYECRPRPLHTFIPSPCVSWIQYTCISHTYEQLVEYLIFIYLRIDVTFTFFSKLEFNRVTYRYSILRQKLCWDSNVGYRLVESHALTTTLSRQDTGMQRVNTGSNRVKCQKDYTSGFRTHAFSQRTL